MTKIYTAQEMRELADKLESRKEYAVCCFDANDNEWRPVWQNPDSIILALRQAADMMEREKKYEYKVLYRRRDGRVFDSIGHADGIEIALETLRVYAAYNDARIVRRPVGEWEEVRDATN